MKKLLLYIGLIVLTGCTNCSETTDDVRVKAAWQQYDEACKAKDMNRTLAVIDSMEQAAIIGTARADYLRAFAYDRVWQMRIAEHYFKKACEGYGTDPSQNWYDYADAGYRWAYLLLGRGDNEGALGVTSGLLAQSEGNEDFPKSVKMALQMLMANCQLSQHQYEEARHSCQKAYETQQQLIGDKATDGMDYVITCMSISAIYFEMGDVEGAQEWLDRCAEKFAHYEQVGSDSILIEEWRGHIALKRARYLHAAGHAAEAAATYAAIPRSRIFEPRGCNEAADYLMAAGRYDDAAYWYERLDSTYKATDGAQMTFDNIADRLSPRFFAYRKAGRDGDALGIADSISAAIDSALVWQKNNDAAELAVVYQTHEKELALEESEAKATIYRILVFSLFAIMLIFLLVLWRLAIAYRRTLIKNRKIYEIFRSEHQREVNDIQRIARQPEQERTQGEQLFFRLTELMKKEQPYTHVELNRDTLASMLGTNHRYIDDAIRECSGSLSTKAFIDGYRVDHAARLLSDTDKPIALIAEMSGFANRTTFNEQFRSRYKMTPSEFRRAARAETKQA